MRRYLIPALFFAIGILSGFRADAAPLPNQSPAPVCTAKADYLSRNADQTSILTITIAGGRAPYRYILTPDAGAYVTPTEGTINFSSGTANATVKFTESGFKNVIVKCIDANQGFAYANVTYTVSNKFSCYAGPDQYIKLSQTAVLSAAPSGGKPPYFFTWGPAPAGVLLSSTSAQTTYATFPAIGAFPIPLSCRDSNNFVASDALVVNLSHDAPRVSIAPVPAVWLGCSEVLLDATVSDPSNSFTVYWSRVSGPGLVSFSNPTVVDTKPTFSAVGTYVLQLSAVNIYGLRTTINVSVNVTANPVAPHAYVANYYSHTVSVINLATDSVCKTIPVETNPYGVAVHPDRNSVYVTNKDDSSVSVISTATNTVSATIPVRSAPTATNPNGSQWPTAIVFSQDGSRAYVAFDIGSSLAVINTQSLTVAKYINLGARANDLGLTPDGRSLYASHQWQHTVDVIDTASESVRSTIGNVISPMGIAFTPDGSRAYLTDYGQLSTYLYVIDVINNRALKYFSTTGPFALDIAISPKTSKGYVTSFDSRFVSVFQAPNDTFVRNIDVGAPSAFIAISPDNDRVYASLVQGANKVAVIDAKTDSLIKTINVGNTPYGIAILSVLPTP